MSHKHYCDHAGHEWECDGKTMRPLAGDTEPSVCVCESCQVPMEQGDHSECAIELLACPQHMDEQLREIGFEPGTSNMPQRGEDAGASMFQDADGKPTVGFCLWCDEDFYNFEESEAHNANGSATCPVFQELKNEGCVPPVLQAMLEDT